MQPINRWTTILGIVALSFASAACATSDTDQLSGAAVQQEDAATTAEGADAALGPIPTIRPPTIAPPRWSPTPVATAVPGAGTAPCCQTFSFRAGNGDDFVTTDGAEPVAPSQGLIKRLAQAGKVSKGFDDPKIDTYFAHTFRLPAGGCIDSAALYIRARPEGDGTNDALTLSFTDPVTGALDGTYQDAVAYFGAAANPTGAPGLWSNAWTSVIQGPTPASRLINLGQPHAPVTGAGTATLLDGLKARRTLDVILQDDTNVDWLGLDVKFCDCPPGAGGAGGQAISDPALAVPVDEGATE